MRRAAKASLFAFVAAALVLGWGYWHSQTHADLLLSVHDYGGKTANSLYERSPHDVALTFRAADGRALAAARSVEPLAYILAVHTDPTIGNCEHREGPDHVDCYDSYSRWTSGWAPQVRTADVKVGACELRAVPVEVRVSNDDWWLWWVPLPHVGGTARRSYDFTVSVDARACRPVTLEPRR